MKTVLTYGTFDLLHYGHVRILKRLRLLGDRLVVGLSTDEFNRIKGKDTIISYEHRKELLESLRYVDFVFPESCWEQKVTDIREQSASIFAMGDDWAGKFDHLQGIVEVIYLPRTQDISTTELKIILSAYQKESIFKLKNTLENALLISNELLG